MSSSFGTHAPCKINPDCLSIIVQHACAHLCVCEQFQIVCRHLQKTNRTFKQESLAYPGEGSNAETLVNLYHHIASTLRVLFSRV